MNQFVLKAPYAPSGDQPAAIESLSEGVKQGLRDQVLLGVTGSGKTFTMASIIEKVQKPTLVLAIQWPQADRRWGRRELSERIDP